MTHYLRQLLAMSLKMTELIKAEVKEELEKQTGRKLNIVTEERTNCPQITNAAKKHFAEGMKSNADCFRARSMTCNVKEGEKIDDISGCEVAYIGHNYTWHTHACGTQPSQADILSTRKLGKDFLCIGHSPSKKTVCYDMRNGKVACTI